MDFTATVTVLETEKEQKYSSELSQVKNLLTQALSLLIKTDNSYIDEARAILDGGN